jgi:hypothetical protein
MRNVEAAVALAERDLVMLPAAMVVVRAVVEISFKLRWMMNPTDPFEREVRWLAHLETEELYYKRLAEKCEQLEADATGLADVQKSVHDYRIGILNVLPKDYQPISKLPHLERMMIDLHDGGKYAVYCSLCQFTHGTRYATRFFDKTSNRQERGWNSIQAKDWYPVFLCSWYSLHSSGFLLYSRLHGNVGEYLDDEFFNTVRDAIAEIQKPTL